MGKEERGSVRVPAPRRPPMNEMMTSAVFHRRRVARGSPPSGGTHPQAISAEA